MREILFRGKRKDTGEWVRGSLVRHAPDEYHIVNIIVCRGGDEIEDSFPVIIETIDQYSGHTDKNENKIFEGDIVEGRHCIYKEPMVCQVVYDFDSIGYRIHKHDISLVAHIDNLDDIKVIGNIHDNPELLEVE